MKIVIVFCTICTIASKIQAQSFLNGFQSKRITLPDQIPTKTQEKQRDSKNNGKFDYDKYLQETLDKKLTEQANKGSTPVVRDNGQFDYDKYLQEILDKKLTEQANKGSTPVINDNVNLVSGGQSPSDSDESPITSKPVRFVGVGKTDVEYLNNVTYAITNFGVNLMKSVNNLQTGNIIVSPTSIATILALLQQGTVGDAQNEITRFLQMTPDVTAPTYRRLTYDMKKRNSRNILTVSNNLYISDGFEINPHFRENAIQNFGSEVTVMDFSRPVSAVKQINKWVSIQTHNKIEELLPYSAVNHNTQLVFANAVYFKGLWETKFRPEATKTLLFHLSSGDSIGVPFLRIRHTFKYGIDEDNRSYIAIMPFERHQYSLILILPHETSDADATLNTLTNTKLVSYHNFPEIELQLEIPKFTIKSNTDMISVLKSMGVNKVFSSQTDLTGMGTYRTFSPKISQALHTGFLSVDEQGLSAVGAAAFAAVALSYDDPPEIFQANRPFIAVLWDTQFAIPLFIAKIQDPSQ